MSLIRSNQIHSLDASKVVTASDRCFVTEKMLSNIKDLEMPNNKNLKDFITDSLAWEENFSKNDSLVVEDRQDAWVKNATIKGNTVKNLLESTVGIMVSDGYNNKFTSEARLNYMKITAKEDVTFDSWGMIMFGEYIQKHLKPGTKYTLAVKTKKAFTNGSVSFKVNLVNGDSANSIEATPIKVPSSDNKITYVDFLTKDTLPPVDGSSNNKITICFHLMGESFKAGDYMEIEVLGIFEAGTVINDNVSFGLNGTKTAIKCNDVSYPIMLNDKNIELHKVDDVADTLEILEDGSGVLTQYCYKATLSSDMNPSLWFEQETQNDEYIVFCYNQDTFPIAKNDYNAINVVSDNLKAVTRSYIRTFPQEECIASASYDCIVVSLLRTKLKTQDVNGFKQYLANNPITCIYKLASPIITRIPKEQVPIIATAKGNNVFQIDSNVPSGGFSVTTAKVIHKQLELDLDNKVKINGESTNVDLKVNEIIQEGLVINESNVVRKSSATISYPNTDTTQFENKDFTFFISKLKVNEILNTFAIIGWRGLNTGITYYGSGVATGLITYGIYEANADGTNTGYSQRLKNFKGATKNTYIDSIVVRQRNGQAEIIFEGTKYLLKFNKDIKWGATGNFNTSGFTGEIGGLYLYDRALTDPEINHNLLVLASSQSINKINDYAVSTNFAHVEMPNGKTLRDFAYSALDWKEFTSESEDISIENGKEAWLRSAKIEGQTVKCIYADKDWVTPQLNYGWRSAYIVGGIPQLKPNSTYVMYVEVKENTLNANYWFSYCNSANYCKIKTQYEITPKQTGVFVFNVSTQTNSTIFNDAPNDLVCASREAISDNSQNITFRRCLLEISDTSLVKNFVPFGLTSTKAIITANDVNYPIMINGEVVELNKVGNVADTLEVLEDGSGVLTKRTHTQTFNDSTTFQMETDTLCKVSHTTEHKGGARNGNVILEAATLEYAYHTSLNEHVYTDSGIHLWITGTVEEVKKRFLNTKIVYSLEDPIITYIPASQMPIVATTKGTNTFKVNSAVAASNFAVNTAIDAVADLEKRLFVLENIAASKSNLFLLDNFIEDEFNKELENMPIAE